MSEGRLLYVIRTHLYVLIDLANITETKILIEWPGPMPDWTHETDSFKCGPELKSNPPNLKFPTELLLFAWQSLLDQILIEPDQIEPKIT